MRDVKMPMMALLPPGGLLGGYAGDPGGVNGSWVPDGLHWALETGELAHPLLRARDRTFETATQSPSTRI